MTCNPTYDLLVIGAGINGAGIARDAAGRGLRVLLIDQGDIGGATSSASTKLIHGGLRYLENYAFGLVRESLVEREILLTNAPHLMREQRFVIPHQPALRPRWMIRLGLALYDGLARGTWGGRAGKGPRMPGLKPASSLALRASLFGAPLKAELIHGFSYSDLATDDARLTLLNVVSAAQLGAQVMTHTRLVSATREEGMWNATLESGRSENREQTQCTARIIVNAAGPWVAEVRRAITGIDSAKSLRLVKGSHIVVPKLYQGDHAYLLQNTDGRIVFVIPYETEWSLIGTTEVVLTKPDARPTISAEEVNYLCAVTSQFFKKPVESTQVVWSFSGIRALFDDGRANASAVTREYRFVVDGDGKEAPMLSIYGGKLTTYRYLAERALEKLKPWLPNLRPAWTTSVHLPGGGLGPRGLPGLLLDLSQRYAMLPPELLEALARRHGDLVRRVLGTAQTVRDLGECFGGDLYAQEVDYMRVHEWARDVEDIIWRRTKCGLRMDEDGQRRLHSYLMSRVLL